MSKAKKFFAESAKQAAAAEKQRQAEEAAEKKRIEEEERRAYQQKVLEDPYSTLDALLILALYEKFGHAKIGINGKPKKFLDKVWYLKDYVKPAVLGTCLEPMFKSPFPLKTLSLMADHWLILSGATDQFSEAGYQGLVIYKQEIYPVSLYMQDDEAQEWAIKNESQVLRMVAHCAAVAFELDAIQCHVLLFGRYGFSHRMASVGHRVVDIKEAFPDQDEANVVNLVRVVA